MSQGPLNNKEPQSNPVPAVVNAPEAKFAPFNANVGKERVKRVGAETSSGRVLRDGVKYSG